MTRLLKIIVLCIVVLNFSACANQQQNLSFSFYSDGGFNSLDPQLATTTTELTTSANCFEGLTRFDDNNNIVCGAASSYDLSNDKKVYTFYLRENLVWSDSETPVTADDFAFGLTRAILPETKSKHANLLFGIKNASEIAKGKMSSSEIGISVISDYILKITLEYDDKEFLSALSHPVAMPCNRSFFENTKGKYGLSKEFILTNGSFYLHSISFNNNYLRISRSEKYNGEFKAKTPSISIGFNQQLNSNFNKLINKSINIAKINNENAAELEQQGYKSSYLYNTAYSLYVSPQLPDNVRQSLIYGIDYQLLNINSPEFIRKSGGILSSETLYEGSPYRKAAGDLTVKAYRPQKELLTKDDFKMLKSTYLYCIDNDDINDAAKIITQTWQKDLSAYVSVKPVDENKLIKMITSGESKLAILPVKSKNNSAFNTLVDLTYLKIPTFNNIIKTLTPANTGINQLKKAEQALVNSFTFYPMFEIPDCYSIDERINNVLFSPSRDYLIFNFAVYTDNN